MITPLIQLAGGRITCKRCQALSKRTKQQCGRPAMKGKRVCNFHGGKSTGPKTPEGKARIAMVKTVFGTETRSMRAARTIAMAEMAQLDDMICAASGGKQRRRPGPKPEGYRKLSHEERKQWLKGELPSR